MGEVSDNHKANMVDKWKNDTFMRIKESITEQLERNRNPEVKTDQQQTRACFNKLVDYVSV